MKPQTLKLKNFGPFLDEEVDFEPFQNQGLFLISGKTGAGKTTIFDGMTFALFGKTSGQLRSGKEMRSSFAADGAKTEVSFRFEHQSHFYQISRSPEQEVAKKRGSGFTKQAAKVSLEIYAADSKLIAHYHKKKDVEKRIEELLSVNAEQFFQIILLPQGEFRQFLIAPSDEKEKLLRHLFGTQIYQRLNDYLQEKRKKLTNELQRQMDYLEQLKNYFQMETSTKELSQQATLELWQKELVNLKLTVSNEQKQIADFKEQEKQAEKAFYQAKETNERIAEYKNTLQRHEELQKSAAKIDQLQNQLIFLNWLNENKPLLTQEKELQEEQLEAQSNLLKIRQKRLENQKNQQDLLARQNMFDAWQKQFEKNQYELHRIKERLPLAKEIQKLEEKSRNIATELLQSQKKQTELQEKLSKKRLFVEQVEQKILTEADIAAQEVHLSQCQTLVEQYKQLQAEHHLLLNDQQSMLKIKEQLQRQVQEQQELVAQSKAAFEKARSQNAQLQIARLSLLLEPGQPCPVCGSTEHKVEASSSGFYSSEQIKESESLLSQSEADYQKAQLDLQKVRTMLANQEEKKKELLRKIKDSEQKKNKKVKQCEIALNISADQIDLQDCLSERQEELNQAKQELQAAKAQRVDLYNKIQSFEKELVSQNDSYQALKTQDAQRQSRLATLVEQVGSVNSAYLEEQQAQFSQENTALQKKLQGFQAQKESCQKNATIFSERLNQQKAYLQNLEKKRQKLQMRLIRAIETSGYQLTIKKMRDLLGELTQLPQLKQQIEKYQKEKSYLKERLVDLSSYATAVSYDLAALQLALQEAEDKTTRAQQKLIQLTEKQRLNQQTYQDFKQSYQKNKAQVEELSQMSQLVDTMNGNNEQKLGIERYVLQAYLAEILETANYRLAKLSQGRYQFQLSKQQGSYKKSTGLEIDIFDDHAGVSRRAHTLSGGESFIAALALALSLGDVIQNHEGGVAIEALFIDEGFGSLDEDALEMAIEALEMVEDEGRMIGIISHVGELKNRINQQLLVEKKGNGQSFIKVKQVQ